MKANNYHLKSTEMITLVCSIQWAPTILVKYNNMVTTKMLEEWKTELDEMLVMVRKDMSNEAALSK